MDRVIERALKDSGISYALTNLVACIPLGDDGTKAAEPDEVCIKSCSSRLKEVIALVSPNLIVCVGALAKRHVSRYIDAARYDMVHITHPAAIIRAPYASQALSIQKAVVTVANAVAKLSRGKEK
jgi:uracil-DNA glycosylase